jgi:serine/threonine protein kinase
MPAVSGTSMMGRVLKGSSQIAGSGSIKGARVLASRYTLADEIGRGASGVVFKALDMQTGGMVAIKEVAIRGESKEQMQLLQREIDLLKLLKNPYIVEYHESFNTRDTLFIVMEFVENGSLSMIIKKFGRLQESLVTIYMVQILEGLTFLHEQGVIHRDIKGANILISTGGKVKLADFGVATKLEAAGLDTQANSVVGTPYWMAPEIIQMSGFTTASDIWSVGCTIIELTSGAPPFFDLAPMSALFRIVHENHPPLPPNISPHLKDFLLQCFKKDTVA